ncbi:hypothetical protein NQ176_g2703 [Zarea fungicola]|uniref:Uncharacterized protein n=1 Tax=Zarea fungicola TaxID=93591 RepID=A0ACC1NLX1_9HYPO|nr:hypothetical protein NQ176_g2703 [Lecanicillium fungicola]
MQLDMGNDFQRQLGLEQSKMKERMSEYEAAWDSAWKCKDFDLVSMHFADDGLDYSDYGVRELQMDKSALAASFNSMAPLIKETTINTTNILGAVDFCIWEYSFEFTLAEETSKVPYRKGERVRFLNATVIEWNAQGRIIKQHDYGVWDKPSKAGA